MCLPKHSGCEEGMSPFLKTTYFFPTPIFLKLSILNDINLIVEIKPISWMVTSSRDFWHFQTVCIITDDKD